jgi:hypothetical protein
MKAKIILLALLFCYSASFGQLKSITNDLNVKNSFQLSLNKVVAISKDTTLATRRDNYLITEKAVKDLVANRMGSGGGGGGMTLPYVKTVLSSITGDTLVVTNGDNTTNTFDFSGIGSNAITGLTGDVTATGPGSVAATLATVNGTPGSFGSSSVIPTFTVNGKGLITSVVATPILTASSFQTGLLTSGDYTTLFGKRVASFGKNASLDSFILILADGTRYAAKDSSGGGGSSLPSQTGNAGKLLQTDGTNVSWQTVASGITTMQSFGNTPNANGATISTTNLTIQPADSSFGGAVSNTLQNFKGSKIFYGDSLRARLSGSTNYLSLEPGITSLKPKIRFGLTVATFYDISINSGATFFTTSLGIDATGLVKGTGLLSADVASFSMGSGSLGLNASSSNAAFIGFMQNGAFFSGALGTNGTTGDLIYYRTPGSLNSFGGTETFRIVRSTGNLTLNTSTDVPSVIFNVNDTLRGVRGVRLTTVQRLAKSTGIITGGYTTSNGSGYTNGTYTNVPLIGGTGSGAIATVTVVGGTVAIVLITTKGSGYVVGDVLTFSGLPAGSGASITLTSFFVTEGEEVYDLTDHKKYIWNGTLWSALN